MELIRNAEGFCLGRGKGAAYVFSSVGSAKSEGKVTSKRVSRMGVDI